MGRRQFALGGIALALVVAGCGGGGGGGAVEVPSGSTTPAGVPAVTTTSVPTRPAPTTPGSDDDTAPATDGSAGGRGGGGNSTPDVTVQSSETFLMPDVRGKNLQDAQDELQARGSYLMDQEDAGGEHRIQVLDSNWKVCTQLPRAGARVPISTVVRLAAVKLDERCP